MIRRPPRSTRTATLFPYTTLFRSAVAERADVTHTLVLYHFQSKDLLWIATMEAALAKYGGAVKENLDQAAERSAKDTLANFIDQFVRMSDRKSTRLNSSH